MGEIRQLADGVINRIAAGEVVERPASVAKELVENALDAGARTVRLILLEGGSRLISVEDDGCGMDRDDAVLAFERHATSKIRDDSELKQIRSFGFRGEALPSIASVSRCLMRTRARNADSATEIMIEGGALQWVREVGHPAGTMVEIRDLFYNQPARRKFLKKPGTELSHITAAVTRAALAHHEVRFSIEHDERELFDWPRARGVEDRVYQVYGEETAAALIPIHRTSGSRYTLQGLVAPVRFKPARRRKTNFMIFVNGRPVTDRLMVQAVRAAYRTVSPAAGNPFCILFLRMIPEEVDVNVHPAKTEVRFKNSGTVFQLVNTAVLEALTNGGRVPRAEQDLDGEPATGGSYRTSTGGPDLRVSPRTVFRVQDASLGQGPSGQEIIPTEGSTAHDSGIARTAAMFVLPESASGIHSRRRILAQLMESYILVEDPDGLLLVDQHVAHERILYERYRNRIQEHEIVVQQLLVPQVIELDPSRRILLESNLEQFRQIGIEVEHFGGNTFLFKGHPDFLDQLELEPFLLESLNLLEEDGGGAGSLADQILDRMIISAACHAAVKVNTVLGMEKMDQLIADLLETGNAGYCPHGRPIVLRVSRTEIERKFGRR